MCIIFYYIAKYSPSPRNQHFKFILAANRDEFYFRPTKMANFWENGKNILAGQDLESGGAWLGVNKKTGRLAALTNIMGGTDREKQKQSRGNLITNFLSSQSTLDGETYCLNLYKDSNIAHNFNKFNLLTVDFPHEDQSIGTYNAKLVPSVYYFSNSSDSPPVWQNEHQAEYFGLGNSILTKPFQKVTRGCKVFQELVEKNQKHPDLETSRSILTEDLLKLLRNEATNYPDPHMSAQSKDNFTPLIPSLSSTFVRVNQMSYGTRTHTLVFVDYNNQVYFSEWTMSEPIIPERPTWHESNYNFQLFS